MTEPHLGYATTRELLVELEARMTVDRITGDASPSRVALEQACRVALNRLPDEVLEYRTTAGQPLPVLDLTAFDEEIEALRSTSTIDDEDAS